MGISCYTLRVKGGNYSYYTLQGIGGPYSTRRVVYDTSVEDTKHLSFLPLIFHGLLHKEIWKLVRKTIVLCPIGLQGHNHVCALFNLYTCCLSHAGWTQSLDFSNGRFLKCYKIHRVQVLFLQVYCLGLRVQVL